MLDFERIVGFDWNTGNSRKNDMHGVSLAEAEQAFFNQPLVIASDERHSLPSEARHHALGQTDTARVLHITFTLRQDTSLIRIISARTANRKERLHYDKA
jgi:uncharacterized protein